MSLSSQNKQASALLFSMLIIALLMLMGIYLLERVLPTSRDTKGIELGNAAYYFAEGAEEEALAFMSGSNPFVMVSPKTSGVFTGTGYSYAVSGLSSKIPKDGNGNGDDTDWNTIAPGNPIQLRFWGNLDWIDPSAFQVRFRIPKKWNGYTFANTGSGFISWTLSDGSGATLISTSGSLITGSDIQDSLFSLTSKMGSDISTGPSIGTGKTVAAFYGDHTLTTKCATQKCTLRFSLVESLNITNGPNAVALPYLEYQIQTAATAPIPEQYAAISTEGYYRGFRKTLTRKIRQTTVNEALGFAVFQ